MRAGTIFALGIMTLHVTMTALGIAALLSLPDDALPAWQVSILTRAVVILPLFVFLSEVLFVQGGRYPSTPRNMFWYLAPLTIALVFAVLEGDGSWQAFALRIATPIMLAIGVVWLWFGLCMPLVHMATERTKEAWKTGTMWLGLFLLFSIPALGVTAAVVTYTFEMFAVSGMTLPTVLSLLSMAWFAVSDGRQYVHAMLTYG